MSSCTREYTITEALQELKLLSNRIQKLISSSTFITVVRSDSGQNPDETGKEFASRFQSIHSLIERRAQIKAAIMLSNASTKVEIAGKLVTVAEAISTKDYVKDQQHLLEQMKLQKAETVSAVNRFNVDRQMKIDSLIERSFGREGTNKQNPEDIKSISDIYMKKNFITVVDPISIDEKIAKLEESIDVFLHTVDHKLSYINAITKITV